MENYQQVFIETSRLRTAFYRVGEGNPKKLLAIHGNLSSSVFFMPLAPYLEEEGFDIVVPDLRCFGYSQALPIDAARGYRDWSDDIYSLCEALGWEEFTLIGWSMGGDVAMQFTIDHRPMVKELVLVAPGPPYGFGGTRDEEGTPYSPIGLGSGGGCANSALVMSGQMWDKTFFWNMMRQYLFKPPFRMSREWEERFTDSASRVQLGPDYYPGNYEFTLKWPYIIAGDRGVLNTMSPKYGNLSDFLEIDPKPPVLWIRGDADQIVSDTSMMELGYLGKMGIMPGWPGEEIYPPQPMIQQTKHFFEQYKEKGGQYIELVIPGGHVCILESPLHFINAMKTFVELGEKKPAKAAGVRKKRAKASDLNRETGNRDVK